MLHLPFRGGSFDSVVSFFTSIGYFESDAENERVLLEMARVLAPGGRLVLETLNPAPTIAGLVSEEEKRIAGHRVRMRRWYDSRRRRLNKEIVFKTGGADRTYLETVRVYEPAELFGLIEGAGLSLTSCDEATDDGTIRPQGEGSPRLMLFAERARH